MGNTCAQVTVSKKRTRGVDLEDDDSDHPEDDSVKPDRFAHSRNPANGGAEAPVQAKPSGFLGMTPWPSRSFNKIVANHDAESDGDAVDSLKEFFGEEADDYTELIESISAHPQDSRERQIGLVQAYTAESPIYHKMNLALRNDDAEVMKKLAGYIWELREVFLTDGINQITQPHTGTLYRGISFPSPEDDIKNYKKDEKFAWPAFTSTSTDRNAALNFGNIIFEIRCYPLDGLFEDDKPEFAPAGVSQWSQFPQEAEIIFPPNTEFRVVNIQYPGEDNDLGNFGNVYALVQCETTAFDSIYGMIEAGDTEGVKKWTEQNKDRVKTNDCEYSLVEHAEEHHDEDDDSLKTRGVALDGEATSPLAVLLQAGAT
eukprot:gnl/MRDRNA2_/MRDRNA2_120958_c0_seq1.p1 gnl/MRDRNA2_/MRDRNA2_120958_c0~~gnl/MRDRNA2_/MRDRNA2_120958_c0_seq1.p1  ORF type:complete len:372 (-),score=79.88 gnl/MRDRNA2_/MRDRNA2_120958_c0_seq1:8-1123(-)